MVNQDPEPKIMSTTHNFPVAPTVGGANLPALTNILQGINTFQANNEQITIWGLAVNVIPLDVNGNDLIATAGALNPYYYRYQTPPGGTTGTFTDFDVKVLVGGNQIPSNDIQIQRLLMPGAEQQRYISFSSPILVRYQQPLQVTVENNVVIAPHRMGGVATDVRTVRVVITLLGQNEIIKNIGVN